MNFHALSQLADAIYEQRPRPLPALFVHASGDLRAEMVEFISTVFRACGSERVYLNGIAAYLTGQPGYEAWRVALVEAGVPSDAIIATSPATHTGAEASEFVRIIRENGYSRVGVISIPMHIMRAFLTDLGTLRSRGVEAKLFPLTRTDIPWFERIEIRPLLAPDVEYTTRLGRLIAEVARIIHYREKRVAGDEAFLIASPAEGLAHLREIINAT